MHYKVNRSEIVSDLIDGEIILLDLRAGIYYNLDGTAAILWQWLEGGASTEALQQALTQAFPEQAPEQLHEDLAAWLQDLSAHRLVMTQEEGCPRVSGPGFAQSYSRPQLFAHADMEELLKLDPVHEVGDPGWPSAPAQ